MRKYWHIYFLVLVWCLYDGLCLAYGRSHAFVSLWHIGMLVFIFVSIKEKLPKKNFPILISFISFLFVISIKILLNLIAAFGADYQTYNSFVNNVFIDFFMISIICIVHVVTGVKEWIK